MFKLLLIAGHVSYSLATLFLELDSDVDPLQRGLAHINVRESPGNQPLVSFSGQGGVYGSLDSSSMR